VAISKQKLKELLLSADDGDIDCMIELGEGYITKEIKVFPYSVGYKKGLMYLKKASDLGSAWARYNFASQLMLKFFNLGYAYLRSRTDFDLHIKWIKKSVPQFKEGFDLIRSVIENKNIIYRDYNDLAKIYCAFLIYFIYKDGHLFNAINAWETVTPFLFEENYQKLRDECEKLVKPYIKADEYYMSLEHYKNMARHFNDYDEEQSI